MSDFKVGQHITVKLSGGRLVDAEIKAVIETTEGIRLQVSTCARLMPTAEHRREKNLSFNCKNVAPNGEGGFRGCR